MDSIFFYLIIGVISGIASGLLGVGGGTVSVPLLLLAFSFSKIPPQYHMHVAIGTSLASMVFNTLTAAFFHYKKKHIPSSIFIPLLPGIFIGSIIGVIVAKKTSGAFLCTLFAFFLCFIGAFLLKKTSPVRDKPFSRKFLALMSFPISFLSNLLGLGGGTFLVPFLLYEGVSTRIAVGVSTASSFLISLLGTLGHLSIAKNEDIYIPLAIGFIYLPAFIGISLTSIFFSYYGTNLSSILPADKIRRIFALALVSTGIALLIFK